MNQIQMTTDSKVKLKNKKASFANLLTEKKTRKVVTNSLEHISAVSAIQLFFVSLKGGIQIYSLVFIHPKINIWDS